MILSIPIIKLITPNTIFPKRVINPTMAAKASYGIASRKKRFILSISSPKKDSIAKFKLVYGLIFV